MKKYSYLLTLGLLGLLASCSNDDIPNAEVPEGVKTFSTFYATVTDDIADTRSFLVNDSKVYFEDGDGIVLFSGPGLTTPASYYTFNASNNYFTGEPVSGTTFTAIYPFNGGTYYTNGTKYLYTLQRNVTHCTDSYSQPMPMIATTKNGNNYLEFQHTTGLIRIALSGSLTLNTLTLRGNNGEQIAGYAEIETATTPSTLRIADNYVDEYDNPIPVYTDQIMNVSGITLTPTPTYFYFVVPQTNFTAGITLEIDAVGLSFPITLSTASPVNVGRQKMITLSAVDTDETLKTEASADLATMNLILAGFNNDPALLSAGWGDPDIANWSGVTSDNGVVTGINISNFGVSGTISESIGNLKNLQTLDLSNNNITGNLPASLINLTKLTSLDVSNNLMDGFVYDEVCFTPWWTALNPNITQKLGNVLKLGYISSDFTNDGVITATLQTHTVGNGIPIYITGEAYSDRLQTEFNTKAAQAMEYFFSIEPYKTHRNYFDVYRLTKVSKNEGVRDGADIAYGTTAGVTSYNVNGANVRQQLKTTLGLSSDNDVKDMLAIVLLHLHGESKRAICFFDNFGFGAALIPVNDDMERVIHHEAGGHGFACLADEYDTDDPGTTTFPTSQYATLDEQHVSSFENPLSAYKWGWNKNVDYDLGTTTIQWAEFLKYENTVYVTKEGVAAYEGAHAMYKKGIYRSTDNSVMRDHTLSDMYNPQSRWLIYRRIMIQGKGLSAEPAFADFKTYDLEATVNQLPPVAVMTRSYVEKPHGLLGAPPITEVR